MDVTEAESKRIQDFLFYFIEKKHKSSGGNNGLTIVEFVDLIEKNLLELEKTKKILKKKTINNYSYFKNGNNNRT